MAAPANGDLPGPTVAEMPPPLPNEDDAGEIKGMIVLHQASSLVALVKCLMVVNRIWI
jgi:hypothetical protein